MYVCIHEVVPLPLPTFVGKPDSAAIQADESPSLPFAYKKRPCLCVLAARIGLDCDFIGHIYPDDSIVDEDVGLS